MYVLWVQTHLVQHQLRLVQIPLILLLLQFQVQVQFQPQARSRYPQLLVLDLLRLLHLVQIHVLVPPLHRQLCIHLEHSNYTATNCHYVLKQLKYSASNVCLCELLVITSYFPVSSSTSYCQCDLHHLSTMLVDFSAL